MKKALFLSADLQRTAPQPFVHGDVDAQLFSDLAMQGNLRRFSMFFTLLCEAVVDANTDVPPKLGCCITGIGHHIDEFVDAVPLSIHGRELD